VWFVIVLIWFARQRLRSGDCFRRSACLGALTGIFGVAIHSFFDFGLHPTANALVFMALVVIATAKVHHRDTEDTEGAQRAYERKDRDAKNMADNHSRQVANGLWRHSGPTDVLHTHYQGCAGREWRAKLEERRQ
jgi:hypothetical protein